MQRHGGERHGGRLRETQEKEEEEKAEASACSREFCHSPDNNDLYFSPMLLYTAANIKIFSLSPDWFFEYSLIW